MISIVIPLYNKELYIKDTISKVLNQTYQSFELIVVNDGSQDNSAKIVESFNDSRIKLIHQENKGVAAARNKGIENAKYDYVAFLDADDEWLPNHLSEIHKLLLQYSNEADVFVTNFARKFQDKKIVPNRNKEELERGIIDDYFKAVLIKAVIHTSCVCVSRKALEYVNKFDERISRGEDLSLWFKLARNFNIAYSPIITQYYQQNAINNSNRRFNIKKSYTYYINSKDFINKDDKRAHNKILIHKYLSLLFKDFDFESFIKLLRKQGLKL